VVAPASWSTCGRRIERWTCRPVDARDDRLRAPSSIERGHRRVAIAGCLDMAFDAGVGMPEKLLRGYRSS
jgi:hypothetical protein